MAFSKESQVLDRDGFKISPAELDDMMADDIADLQVSLEPESDEERELLSKHEGEEVKGEIMFEIGDETFEEEFSFSLPLIPGGENQESISQDEEPSEIEVSDKKDEPADPWKWEVKGFLPWLQSKIKGVPRHSGQDTVGLMRAIEYLKECDKHCARAARQDINAVMDIGMLEKAREEILDGIDRLEKHLNLVEGKKFKKKKKKADAEDDSLVKEGTQAGKFEVAVPLLISTVARTCINSVVSAGHDIHHTFNHMVKKYDLDKREQLEVIQLLRDMGYSIFMDRALYDEDFDPTSSDNHDFAANYQA